MSEFCMVRCMDEHNNNYSNVPSSMTPTEFIKQKSVASYFKCVELNSKSLNTDEKYGFIKTVKDLAILLERYTPSDMIKELKEWYKQLESLNRGIDESTYTQKQKDAMKLENSYRYALEVHEHNCRILMNSPIIEITAEGELDITDNDIIEVIRGGKRKDDGRITAQ